MKKISVLSVLICVMTISLTSCQVNWFDKHYEVSWWVIAIPVVLFSLLVFGWAGKHISSKKYVCPKCNETLYPQMWKSAISIQVNNDRLFKCPHCGRKGFCHILEDED